MSGLPGAWVIPALALAAGGCASGHAPSPPVASVSTHEPHAQVFHAMKAGARRELVDRLRARNPGAGWMVNEEALVGSLTVVDPFAGFLRRARREVVRPPRADGPVGAIEAAASAREFVKRNADLLGLPRHVVPGLAEQVRAVDAADHAGARPRWVVRFEASFPTRGYEGFSELENTADLEVFVDDDAEVSSFVNVSRIHPHLTIDTRPGLAREDARLLANLVGRKLFALEAAQGQPLGPRDLGGVQALRRMPLGELRREDEIRMQLVVHVAPGPQLAWLTYRLAYLVEVAKPAPPELFGHAPRYFFFRYVVDADGAEVLEDARPPLTPARAEAPL